MKKAAALIAALVSLALSHVGAEEGPEPGFPVITRLDVRDTAFRQYLADVEAARRRVFNRGRNQENPETLAESLTIYSYNPSESGDLFQLAARCNIPYAALATLNRLSGPSDIRPGRMLLLPSMPGLFIPESPGTDLEQLLVSARAGEEGISLTFRRQDAVEHFYFIPGADFSASERIFFLHSGFRFPLRNYRLTSSFGPRVNPVTGVPGFHGGLDLAAPEGTDVYAVREGVVIETAENSVYGKYVMIRHGESWVSLYGHLSAITALLNSSVRSGSLIGRVGSTGQSTGPHLHFELRQNGKALDPGRFLPREGSR